MESQDLQQEILSYLKTKNRHFSAARDFSAGFILFFSYLRIVITSGEVRRWYQHFIGITVLCVVFIALTASIVLAPFQLLWMVVQKVIGGEYLTTSLATFTSKACLLVPMAILTLMRWGFYDQIDNVFFAGVRSSKQPRGALIVEDLERNPPWTTVQQMRLSLRRMFNYAALCCMIYFFSCLPVVGRFGGPFFVYVFIRRVFGIVFGYALPIAMLVPVLEPGISSAFSIWFISRTMMREMFTPYLSRKTYLSDRNGRIEFYRRQDAKMTGFCLPFALAVYFSGSIIAPLMYGVMQAAVGLVVVDIEIVKRRLDVQLEDRQNEDQISLLSSTQENC